MGFFSWNCNGCGHPLLSPHAVNKMNAWMQDSVTIDHTGKILEGFYDGYGRVGGEDINYTYGVLEPCVWHRRCWENAGSPKEYGPSDSAPDQGYFFDEGAHDMKLPRKKPGPH